MAGPSKHAGTLTKVTASRLPEGYANFLLGLSGIVFDTGILSDSADGCQRGLLLRIVNRRRLLMSSIVGKRSSIVCVIFKEC